jgi:chromate transporter
MAHPAPTPGGDAPPPLITDDQLHHDRPTSRRMLIILLVALAIWSGPIVAVALLIGTDSILVDQGVFFSGAALISFGGAYAAITYVAQQAVSAYGWLQPADMVRGLALAETTPGPLILVVLFRCLCRSVTVAREPRLGE